MPLILRNLKPGTKVIDPIHPKRPGGIIISCDAWGVVVEMTFEDGHVGLSQFHIDRALRELALKPPE